MNVANIDLVVSIPIYGRCLEDQGPNGEIIARCYSKLCPDGESGCIATSSIVAVISEEEFESARAGGWE